MYTLARSIGTISLLLFWMAAALGCDLAVDAPPQGDDPSMVAKHNGTAHGPRPAASCENVRGTLTGNVFEYSTMTGSLEGYIVTAAGPPEPTPRGNGAVALKTWHKIEFDEDNYFLTEDEGIMAPVDPPTYRLNNRYTITGGAGMYENASGFIHVHGTLVVEMDPEATPPENNGFIDVTYNGRVCK